MFQQALDIYIQTLGQEHPNTKIVRENLELCRQQQ
ncbi:MAG: hypothetical protein SWX82_12230 [Cyanobacteriota bacterium]|nr:hypothetical protein [Cyanobacteriota bacterium]